MTSGQTGLKPESISQGCHKIKCYPIPTALYHVTARLLHSLYPNLGWLCSYKASHAFSFA